MHRIDTTTAQKDKFGEGKNGFTRGNPQTGVPATDLDDDYFDTLQEELAAIVEAAGDTLDKAQRNQVLLAAQKLFAPSNDTIGALAALIGAPNKLPYFTGPKAATLTDLTSVGRAIIASATKAAVLEYLGIPSSFGSAAEKDVGTGTDQLPTTSQADTRYGLKHWASAGSTLVANQTLIINHGLTINPDLCVLNIKLRCVTANNGYAVGDYAVGFAPRFASGDTSAMTGNLGAILTASQVQFNCGQSGITIMAKSNGTPFGVNTSGAFAQWALEFHIIYQKEG